MWLTTGKEHAMLPLRQLSRHLGLAVQHTVSSRWEKGQAAWQSTTGRSLVAAKVSQNRLTKCSEIRKSFCLDDYVYHGAVGVITNLDPFAHNCVLNAQVWRTVSCRHNYCDIFIPKTILGLVSSCLQTISKKAHSSVTSVHVCTYRRSVYCSVQTADWARHSPKKDLKPQNNHVFYSWHKKL